jgi:hypothetical protein
MAKAQVVRLPSPTRQVSVTARLNIGQHWHQFDLQLMVLSNRDAPDRLCPVQAMREAIICSWRACAPSPSAPAACGVWTPRSSWVLPPWRSTGASGDLHSGRGNSRSSLLRCGSAPTLTLSYMLRGGPPFFLLWCCLVTYLQGRPPLILILAASLLSRGGHPFFLPWLPHHTFLAWLPHHIFF